MRGEARRGVGKFRTRQHAVRHSVGHKGKFGHEFMEFEFKGDGTMRYANNSLYRGDGIIRKKGEARASVAPSCTLWHASGACTAILSPSVIKEVRRIVRASRIVE